MSIPAVESCDVRLDRIAVPPDRLRTLRPEVIAKLAASMALSGLLQPIVVQIASSSTGYCLIAGHHRFEAARKLEWETIAARILFLEDDADRALLAEVDENLIRAELSPAERALHIGRRKEVYERLHPATRHGGDRKSGRSSRQVGDLKRFTKDAARKTGKSERLVQRDVTRTVAVPVLPKIVGTSLDKGDQIDALAKLPWDTQKTLAERAAAGEKVDAKIEAKKQRRAERERELGKRQIADPEGKFGVIVEDYEWDHETWSEAGRDRAAENHYPVSRDAHTAAEIVERTKDRFACAADDCVLFMWSPLQHLAIAIDVLRLRGFEYRSSYAWGKDKIGLGKWSRSTHEILLIGVKGEIPCPAPGTQHESLIMAPRGEHSAKPEIFLEIIEDYYPTIRKIELNRRGPARPGWQSWGNEAIPHNTEEIRVAG